MSFIMDILTPIELLPIPLSLNHSQLQMKSLTTLLEQKSLDEVVEAQLEQIYAWEKVKNPVNQRLYRNTSLVYSRKEIRDLLLATARLEISTLLEA
jgi:hypothetical protein